MRIPSVSLPRLLAGAALLGGLLLGCGSSKERVVLYCSVDQDQFLPLKEAYRTEQTYTRRLLQHPDSAEARRAFAEKREPNWTFGTAD